MRRGAPVPTAPVLMMLVIRPKLPLTAGGLPAKDPMPLDGFLKIGWLNRLYAAARKFSPRRSVIRKRFCSELSISYMPGPLAMYRPRLPHVPFAGSAKAAGLNQLLIVWCAA